MSDHNHGRRTVLETLAALALAPIAASADGDGVERGPPHNGGGRLPPGGPAGPPLANRPDAAIGVVDRIVDGRFVVILVEDEGEVVDQIVLATDDPVLPDVSEGDVLLLGFDGEGDLVAVARLDGETERRRRRNRDRFDDIAEPLDDPEGGRDG